MPALKCLPVEEMTTQRTRPESLISSMISGSSDQKAGIIVLSSSGRERITWATPSLSSISKQVYPMPERLRDQASAFPIAVAAAASCIDCAFSSKFSS